MRYASLAVGSAVTAEFLLGDQYLSGGSAAGQVAALLLYVAYYGSAAVVIREVARHTDRGWPTMLLLALAFAVVEEGLLTQSLFNPGYLGLHKLAYGYLPALGIGLPWTIFVLSLHVVWSIAAPIAIAEAVFPEREPWLGLKGVAGLAALYVVTGALIAVGSMGATAFRPSPAQLLVASGVALAAGVSAFGMPRVVGASLAHASAGGGPIGLVTAFVLLSAFHLGHEAGPAWFAAAVMVGSLAALGIAVLWWRFPGGALGAGAVLVYAWVGLANAAEHGTAAVVEQALLVTLVCGVLVASGRRRYRLARPAVSAPTTTPNG